MTGARFPSSRSSTTGGKRTRIPSDGLARASGYPSPVRSCRGNVPSPNSSLLDSSAARFVHVPSSARFVDMIVQAQLTGSLFQNLEALTAFHNPFLDVFLVFRCFL